jgi:hypothetical protein
MPLGLALCFTTFSTHVHPPEYSGSISLVLLVETLPRIYPPNLFATCSWDPNSLLEAPPKELITEPQLKAMHNTDFNKAFYMTLFRENDDTAREMSLVAEPPTSKSGGKLQLMHGLICRSTLLTVSQRIYST